MQIGRRTVLSGACLLGMAAGAMGQASFVPVSELAGVVPPPAGTTPVNAGQVIMGLAQRYVLALPAGGTRPFERIGVTDAQGQVHELPMPAGAAAALLAGVSDDGTRVLGTVTFANPSHYRACVWDGEVPTLITVGPAPTQQGAAISADGTKLMVTAGLNFAQRTYVIEGGQTASVVPDADDEPQLGTWGQVLSPDGVTVGGLYNTGAQPFQWSVEKGGTVFIAPYADTMLMALISDGGRRMVFDSVNPLLFGEPVYTDGRWSLASGFKSVCMVHDGSLLLGASTFTGRAAVWSDTIGTEDFRASLTARGADVHGWELTDARYVSADGRSIVGRGTPPGGGGALGLQWWVATVSPFAAADMGKAGGFGGSDGRLNTNDFIVFIDRFFAHDSRADVGKAGGERGGDGVFDNNDFCAFIGLFFGGEP
jgi:hypothetical protein